MWLLGRSQRSAASQGRLTTVLLGATSDERNGLMPKSIKLWNVSVLGHAQDLSHNLAVTLHRSSAQGQLTLSAVGGQFFVPFARARVEGRDR